MALVTSLLLGPLAAQVSAAVLGANVLYPVQITRPGGATQTAMGAELVSRREAKMADPANPDQTIRPVLVLASSLAWEPRFGDQVIPPGRDELVVVADPQRDPAGATVKLHSARLRSVLVNLLPPVGAGGEYDATTMSVAVAAPDTVGPLVAIVRDATDDELQKGIGASWWQGGDSIQTGVAVLEQPAGVEVSAQWRIEMDAVVHPIRTVQQDGRFLKVFYA